MQVLSPQNSTGNMSSHMVSPRTVASLANSILSSPKRLFASKQSSSREAERRKHLKIEVVTQPVMKPASKPLPRSATQLLTLLYEALTQAKNCEVMKDMFWKRFNNQQNGHRSYSVDGIERTLETVGVECNTNEDGKPISTGRWILLRNGFFLLRAAHTIRWIANPSKLTFVGEEKDSAPSIVWDWKSPAENWRWNVYQFGEVWTDILVNAEECDSEGSDNAPQEGS